MHVLDVDLADFRTDQQKDDFLASDRVLDLSEFNNQWAYYIKKVKEDLDEIVL